MCILLKSDYAMCGVSDIFFQKLSKKNLCGGGGEGRVCSIPLVQEGLIPCIVSLGLVFHRNNYYDSHDQ